MVLQLKKNAGKYIGILLVIMVIMSNMSIHYLWKNPIASEVLIFSFVDFVVTIPLLIILFLLRKRLTVKRVLFTISFGYVSAILLLPNQLWIQYPATQYGFYICSALIIILLYRTVVEIRTKLNHTPVQGFLFSTKLQHAITSYEKPSRLTAIFISEISMLYYSIFSWRQKPIKAVENGSVFTLHTKTSTIALYIMMIHACILEAFAFHFLLHAWSKPVAIILLILNIYGVLFLLAQIQSIRLCPVLLRNDTLHIQAGEMKKIHVPLDNIKHIHICKQPLKLSRKERKYLFDAVLQDLGNDSPIIEIELHSEVQAEMHYGLKQKVRKIHIRPDDINEMHRMLEEVRISL